MLNFRQQARDKQKENEKFLEKLRQKKPKQLDELMQQAHDEVFKKTNCLLCSNCCKTTGPLWQEKDIDRVAKYLKIKPNALIAKYLTIDEDGDHVLQKLPCVFLDRENYCSIYAVRPKACKEFPHTDRKKFYQINHLTKENLKICPAVYDIIEQVKNAFNR